MDIGSVPGEIGILPGYREVTGTPREPYGPSWALVERRKGQPKVAAPLPPPLVLLGLGEGGRPPSLPSPPRNPSWTRIGGRNPTPRGSRTLLARHPWTASLPPLVLYILRQRHPRNTQVDPRDLFLSRVRCPLPPYSSIIL